MRGWDRGLRTGFEKGRGGLWISLLSLAEDLYPVAISNEVLEEDAWKKVEGSTVETVVSDYTNRRDTCA